MGIDGRPCMSSFLKHLFVTDTLSIDMAYSATLANSRKLISDAEDRRILNLFSRVGLAMDHPQFDEAILDKGMASYALPYPAQSAYVSSSIMSMPKSSMQHY